MAKTAVVNPKRRKRRKRNPYETAVNPRRRRKARRRNYGAAAENPRRRRRASGKRRRSHVGKRRRNPMATTSALGRTRNPFDFDGLLSVLLPATGGVAAARWALNQAGPFETDPSGKPPVPGLKHAFAIWAAAHFGGQLLGQLFGSPAKGEYAKIAALGFGGDLFFRKRFMAESPWVQKNLYLGDVDRGDGIYQENMGTFEASSQIGDAFTDAAGQTYVQTGDGWAVAGLGELGEGSIVQGADGQMYQLSGDTEGSDGYQNIVAGLETGSSLGEPTARHVSSFGYV